MSCGQASARQVIRAKTGENVPEGDLRLQSQDYPGGYNQDQGTRMDAITKQLRENGVPEASEPKHGTVDDLAQATRDGDPAIAHFKEPGHFVTVERVQTNPDGTRSVVVADPARGRVVMPESEFNQRFTRAIITTNR
jgi:predicted double-glycine peptidase